MGVPTLSEICIGRLSNVRVPREKQHAVNHIKLRHMYYDVPMEWSPKWLSYREVTKLAEFDDVYVAGGSVVSMFHGRREYRWSDLDIWIVCPNPMQKRNAIVARLEEELGENTINRGEQAHKTVYKALYANDLKIDYIAIDTTLYPIDIYKLVATFDIPRTRMFYDPRLKVVKVCKYETMMGELCRYHYGRLGTRVRKYKHRRILTDAEGNALLATHEYDGDECHCEDGGFLSYMSLVTNEAYR